MGAGFIVASGGWVYGGDCGSQAYENRFLHAKPNTRNNFLTNFSQHRQTIENILLFCKIFPLENILHVTKHSLSLCQQFWFIFFFFEFNNLRERERESRVGMVNKACFKACLVCVCKQQFLVFLEICVSEKMCRNACNVV